MALLKKRESMTVGRSNEAGELRNQTAALRAQYETRMMALREQLDHERHEAMRLAKDRTDKKIEEAKSGVAAKLLNHQKEVSAEGQKLRTKLPELSMEISKEIVGAITRSRVVRA